MGNVKLDERSLVAKVRKFRRTVRRCRHSSTICFRKLERNRRQFEVLQRIAGRSLKTVCRNDSMMLGFPNKKSTGYVSSLTDSEESALKCPPASHLQLVPWGSVTPKSIISSVIEKGVIPVLDKLIGTASHSEVGGGPMETGGAITERSYRDTTKSASLADSARGG